MTEGTLADTWTRPPTIAERMDSGRAARTEVPRSSLAHLTPHDRDPLGILAEQNALRVQDLIPLRNERMAASPFAFYRGTAALQAADLAADPHSGILVPSCGDAHVANYGFYASRQRTLMFDLNDFDEAAWAPWEWDVKRLITSVVVAGQSTARDETVVDEAVLGAVRTYARAMEANAKRSPRRRFFDHFDLQSGIAAMDPESRDAMKEAIRDAEKRTANRAVRKMTRPDENGRLTFIDLPPTMSHGDRFAEQRLHDNIDQYVRTASPDVRALLVQYEVSDIAMRVVGVGSVGTLCAVVVFQDGDGNALILQAKQAQLSVLEQYGGIQQPPGVVETREKFGAGARVVGLQQILQAESDPFLGHLRAPRGDFYVRQFHDMKGGIEMESLDDEPFRRYAASCAAILARAHSQSSNAAAVAGYIGNGRLVGESLLEWAHAYADLSHADYDAFVESLHLAPAAGGATG